MSDRAETAPDPSGDANGLDELREQLRAAPEMQFEPGGGLPPIDPPEPDDPGPDEPEENGRGEIWKGCPVKPLGVWGDVCYYLDILGQLRAVDNHSLDKIRNVFGGRVELLSNHFPQFTQNGAKKPRKFDQAEAAAAMNLACAEKGVWSPTGRARGAGCWQDENGDLVYHAGDAVLIGGEWCSPGVYDGKVYTASDPIPRPAATEPSRDPAERLLDTLETWTWRRPDIDPVLGLGVIASMMMGGALDWRPVTWLTGDAQTGKSEAQKLLRYVMGGEAGLLQAADATEAGIRSVLGYSSLPVAIDEFEPDPENPSKTTRVIELARRAASGGQIFRGSTDQKGYQGNAYSCFLFSSILLPAMPSQDRSRLIVLNLDRLPENAPKLNLDPRTWRKVGAALRRRLMAEWHTWPDRLAIWRAALADQGILGRAGDNYGTVLAMADLAQAVETRPDIARAWAKKLSAALEDDTVEVGSNADDMLMHLLSQYDDTWRRGERWLVSQLLMAAAVLPAAPLAIYGDASIDKEDRQKSVNDKLAKIGLRVEGFQHEAQLFIANKRMQGLCELFAGSVWADGVWAQAAARIPGTHKRDNNRRLAGNATRGVWVPFTSMPGLLAFPRDAENGVAPTSQPLPPDAEDLF